MKINKYLRWRSYYNFAKRKYFDIKFAKTVLKIEQTTFEGVEILVRANEDVGKEILLQRFEIEELRYLNEILPNDSMILDIGALVYSAWCLHLNQKTLKCMLLSPYN